MSGGNGLAGEFPAAQSRELFRGLQGNFRGPQGIFAKVPGLDFGYRMLTRILPLGRAPVTERDGELYIGD